MKVLDKVFKNSCTLGKNKCSNPLKDVVLIDNFFEDFNEAQKFFLSRDRWRCIPNYQGDDRFGYESLFPNWMGKYLMQKYVAKNKILDDVDSYTVTCNYFYNNNYGTALGNDFPHIDAAYEENVKNYVCLVNLNEKIVSTKFYTYKNQEHCTEDMSDEWSAFSRFIRQEFINHYGADSDPKNVVDKFLGDESDLRLIKMVEYKPNQAILFPMSVYHAPNMTQEWFKEIPRALLRITFYKKYETT